MGSINLQVRVLSARTQFETEQVSSPFEAAKKSLTVERCFFEQGPVKIHGVYQNGCWLVFFFGRGGVEK